MVRKINAKLVLRLRAEGLSFAQIEAQSVSRHSVVKVERAATREGLTWAAASNLSEHEVYERLFPGVGARESAYLQPDWGQVHRELGKVGVTLKLLHAGEWLCREVVVHVSASTIPATGKRCAPLSWSTR